MGNIIDSRRTMSFCRRLSSRQWSKRWTIKKRYYTIESDKFYSRLRSSEELVPTNIVQDKASAQRILDVIRSLDKNHFHSCDTEVGDIDLKINGPVGHGKVTCLSIFSGPDVDYGNGPYVWIDNLDASEGTIEYFREFLESVEYKKVWHNYSFDRHVLHNHGIDVKGLGADTMHMARMWDTSRSKRGGYSLEMLTKDILRHGKRKMADIFGIPKPKKDGSPGKIILLPTVQEMQRLAGFREKWIRYSTFDAESTWFLYHFLENQLKQVEWTENLTMNDFYQEYIVPFGECLTDIERKGILIDRNYLQQIEKQAIEDRDIYAKEFLSWASMYCENAKHMNIGSDSQIRQFFFAPTKNKLSKEELPATKEFKTENVDGIIEEGKTKPKKHTTFSITGIGMKTIKTTAKGWPAVSSDVLRKVAGNPRGEEPTYGTAFDHFGGGKEGELACLAIDALCEKSSIDTMLSNFILPLQQVADANGRVHCSLNLNTETGRLSSRHPNLQNQPALEKDRYKIRDAFIAAPGNKLIVCDYGQLELRILAHTTRCESMIQAFKAGGDFHSRTAMGMYDYVAKAVESGEALLEWDSSKGNTTIPLLKDRFASERRKAKVLNFSIAYGKTVHGLAKDFNVTKEEAAATLSKWYSDRPEVLEWQKKVIQVANQAGYTRTLMGRYRHLPDAQFINYSPKNAKAKAHAERAAINTPIQGGAADVVMKAMLNIHKNTRLRQLGWFMVLQIHDEVILEGPSETSEEALKLVVECMKHPFSKDLLVEMEVDPKVDTSWFRAK